MAEDVVDHAAMANIIRILRQREGFEECWIVEKTMDPVI